MDQLPGAGRADAVRRGAGPRRRDRHGRGPRGPLLPAAAPGARTRAEAFSDLVAIEVERLAQVHSDRLGLLEATVEDVPPMHPDTGGTGDAGDAGGAGAAGSNGRDLGLFRTEPATPDRAARIVVLRRPVEARARAGLAREHLVHRVVVEALAELLGLSPQDVDPDIDPNADDLGD